MSERDKNKLKIVVTATEVFEAWETILSKNPYGKTSKKKTADLVKIASFTLPPSPPMKEWKAKEWNIGMFETPPPPG